MQKEREKELKAPRGDFWGGMLGFLFSLGPRGKKWVPRFFLESQFRGDMPDCILVRIFLFCTTGFAVVPPRQYLTRTDYGIIRRK